MIGDDTRIRESLPTINYAREAGARCVVLASHLGRPKGRPNPEMSLRPVADRLTELLGVPVAFASDCVGPEAEDAVRNAPPGGVVLLENLRFHPEEEKNDIGFARALASLADAYVNDAFGAAHRAHASVEAIVRLMPQAAAGLLMEKELRYLGGVLDRPERPFVAVLGGAKVSDKIEVIENLIPRVDRLLIGGAMAYTFFKAMGKPTGRSLVEDDKLDAARDIMRRAQERGLQFLLAIGSCGGRKARAGRADRGAQRGQRCNRRRHGTGHRTGHRGGVHGGAARRENRGVEWTDGRLRDRRVRAGHDWRGEGRG